MQTKILFWYSDLKTLHSSWFSQLLSHSLFLDSMQFWIMAISSILNFFIPITAAVDNNCDFYQSLMMGQEYYIYNLEYPANYKEGTNCRWLGEGINNSKIVISCEDVALPSVRIIIYAWNYFLILLIYISDSELQWR